MRYTDDFECISFEEAKMMTDRVLAGPEFLCHRFVNDRYLGCIFPGIVFIESPPALKSNSHRFQVTRADCIDVSHHAVSLSGFLAAIRNYRPPLSAEPQRHKIAQIRAL